MCFKALAVAQVGTYQHRWGAVSGGIEGGDESPAARAQQEAGLLRLPASNLLLAATEPA